MEITPSERADASLRIRGRMKRLTHSRSLALAVIGLLAVSSIFTGSLHAQTPDRRQSGKKLLMESGAATKVEERIRSQVQGTVMEVYVKKGDSVTRGQLLAHIEFENAKLQFDLAQQALQSEAELEAAKSQHEASLATLEEAKQAVRRRNAEKPRLDWAAAMESMYRAKYEAQKDAKKNQTIHFEYWKRQYENCFFRAPVDGVVSEVLVESGAFVKLAAHVFTINNENALAIPLTVPAPVADSAMAEGSLPIRSEDGSSVIHAIVTGVKDDPRRAGAKILKLIIDTATLSASAREHLTGMKFDVLLPQVAQHKP
jgi:multidrug efflux pump subunit AcrA (membrane-fusion protein)